MKTKNEKRAFLLAASNHGMPLKDYDNLDILESHWWQGLSEGMMCLGECRDAGGNVVEEDEIEGRAEVIMIDEYNSFREILMEKGISDNDPLPDYWADVDAWLEVNDETLCG